MKKLSLSFSKQKRGSTSLALAQSEFAAADRLIEQKLYKESVVHLYFTCYYASQAALVNTIKVNPGHEHLETQLHRIYGRSKVFPRTYVDLHTRLHKLRIEFNYRNTYSPDPDEVRKESRLLGRYLKFVLRFVPRLEIIDLVRGLLTDNELEIKDFSYDIYCPKTYRHHTRITFWQPPFYLKIFSHAKLGSVLKETLRKLRVRRPDDYVVGLNSRVDQYSDKHLLMLDIDSSNPAVEKALKRYDGVLMVSGRGYHFIGKKVICGQKEWEKTCRKIRNDKILKNCIDKNHVDLSIKRGYSTLRITASSIKPTVPYFYKEL